MGLTSPDGGDCAVSKSHTPSPLRTVVHHIQPTEMGGPDVPGNKVRTCDTSHYSIHRIIDDLLHADEAAKSPSAPMPKSTMTRGSRAEKAYAYQGYSAWVLAGRPGKPVFELHALLGQDHMHYES